MNDELLLIAAVALREGDVAGATELVEALEEHGLPNAERARSLLENYCDLARIAGGTGEAAATPARAPSSSAAADRPGAGAAPRRRQATTKKRTH